MTMAPFDPHDPQPLAALNERFQSRYQALAQAAFQMPASGGALPEVSAPLPGVDPEQARHVPASQPTRHELQNVRRIDAPRGKCVPVECYTGFRQ